MISSTVGETSLFLKTAVATTLNGERSSTPPGTTSTVPFKSKRWCVSGEEKNRTYARASSAESIFTSRARFTDVDVAESAPGTEALSVHVVERGVGAEGDGAEAIHAEVGDGADTGAVAGAHGEGLVDAGGEEVVAAGRGLAEGLGVCDGVQADVGELALAGAVIEGDAAAEGVVGVSRRRRALDELVLQVPAELGACRRNS